MAKREAWTLVLGDILVFMVSFSLMLWFRYGTAGFAGELFVAHSISFSIIGILSLSVYFVAGLYEKHTVILKSRIPAIVLQAQISNSVLAVALFYFIPIFGITPKTNLFLYLFFSLILMLVWRIKGIDMLGVRNKQNALIIGEGSEMHELYTEVNANNRYDLKFVSFFDIQKVNPVDIKAEILERVYGDSIGIIAIDLRNEKIAPLLPSLYNLIFSKVHFIDMYKIYEDIFDRVPVSVVQYSWFLENISLRPKKIYDSFKRVMDVSTAFCFGIVSLVLYPFVILALKLEDGGEIFSVQTRVGQNNRPIKLIKFRTMAFTDGGKWQGEGKSNYITRVGHFLRKTRIDELPQLWNVVLGHISLIGPRPEFADAVTQYGIDIPYYNVRHLIKPGLSGWAQMRHDNHPHHGMDVVETRNKLSYDLYYVKNRSILLDIKIALQTIHTLLSVRGK